MDKIIYNICSYNRTETLLKTIDSIYHQSDVINVVLNSSNTFPNELFDKKINLFLSNNDKGDAYKFLNLTKSNGYFFTIDDDLIYPKDYSDFMINKIEKYNRKKIITLHGRSFNKFPINSYYKDKTKYYHFENEVNKDSIVQFGGTGVMAFHTDLLKIPMEYFKLPNMADIWIGKYSNDNNIDIVCSEHTKTYVKQQKIKQSIYNLESNNDTMQTRIVNESFSDKDVSIIIPTFQNVEYIDDCINSVINSSADFSYEILIGIDDCKETLNHILKNKYSERIKFYYFKENVGPYVIKNTLAKLSKSSNLIFFDSDDTMKSNMVGDFLELLKTYDYVRGMYSNYKGVLNTDSPIFKKNSGLWGEGTGIGIKKYLFLYFNGYEGWKCAADTEFLNRMEKNKVKIFNTETLMFYRRLHEKGITSRNETNYQSTLRSEYKRIIENKNYFGPLDSLKTFECQLLYPELVIDDVKIDVKIGIKEPPVEIKVSNLNQNVEKLTVKENLKNILNKERVKVVSQTNRDEINKKRNLLNKI